jgi:DNA-binding transcriptional LysR family regulator
MIYLGALMSELDINLLRALDALLAEASVARAADRLNLSAPAMSRTLARIRAATGDPILVRAGRRLVPTPRAIAMRERVRAVVTEATQLLRPQDMAPARLPPRILRVRAGDGFAGTFAALIMAAVQQSAPQLALRFMPEGDEDPEALRDGRIDLEIGKLGPMGPEIKTQTLYRDRFVGIARTGHPLLKKPVTAARYAAALHVSASRRGLAEGPIDAAVKELGIGRCVALVVPGFHPALFAVIGSDLLGAVPATVASQAVERGLKIASFELPVKVPPATYAQAWHPRFDADTGHRLLRDKVRAVCSRRPSAVLKS